MTISAEWIGLAVTSGLAIIGAVYGYGRLAARVSFQSERLRALEAELKAKADRAQIEADIRELKTDVKSILKRLAE